MANSATKSSLCCFYCPSGFQERWLPAHEALCAWGSSSWDRVWQSSSCLCCVCQALSSAPCSALPPVVRLSLDPGSCRNMWGSPGRGSKTSNQQQHSDMCKTKLLQQHRDSRAQPGSTTSAVAAWKRRGMWGAPPTEHPAPSRLLSEAEKNHLLFPPLSLGFFTTGKGKVATLRTLFSVR